MRSRAGAVPPGILPRSWAKGAMMNWPEAVLGLGGMALLGFVLFMLMRD